MDDWCWGDVDGDGDVADWSGAGLWERNSEMRLWIGFY